MLKKTYFRNLCHVLQRTLVVSVVCFFTMVSYAWAYNVNFVCGNGATAISGATNPVSVTGFLNLTINDATQYCQTSYSGWQPFAITCRDASQNVKCLIFDTYPGCIVNANLTCTVDFAHKNVSPFVVSTCDGDTILYYSVEQNGDYTLYANYGVNGPSNPVDEGYMLADVSADSCFAGISYEVCENVNVCGGSSSLGHALSNSYGEFLSNSVYGDNGDHGIVSGMFFMYSYDTAHAIRLNSAAAATHGVEFLWYCSSAHVNNPNDSCYGHQPGLYPITRSLACCNFGTYYNSNNIPGHPGYQIDWSHQISIANNANSTSVMVPPTRPGYVFLGYYNTPDGIPGKRIIAENGYIVDENNFVGDVGLLTPQCVQWYAHWCPIGSDINTDDGTCWACPEGTSLNMLYDLNLFNPEDTLSGFGFDVEGVLFGEGQPDYLNETPNTFGVWNVDQDEILLGSAMCSTDDEALSPASSLNVDSQNPEDNKYCWCSLTGGVQNGAQYSLSPSTWVYLTDDLGADCEKYCAQYCAGLGEITYPGGYIEFIKNMLNQEYCTPRPYKVSYYCDKQKWLDGEEPLSVDTVIYGSSGYSFNVGENMTLAETSCGIPEGHHIVGFECVTATNEDPVDDSVANPWTINDDVVCFASYAPNDYTITLNKVNGSGGANNVYTRYNTNVYRNVNRTEIMNTSAYPITTPTRTGYSFMGYYASSGGNNQNPYIDANGFITSAGLIAGKALTYNGTWYAHWTPKTYPISYGSGNHGSVPNNGADPVVYQDGLTYGSTWTTKTFAETGIVADTGYVFSGWNTSADGSGTSYTANTQQSAWTTDSGLTLYAVYNCAQGYSWNNDNTACVQSAAPYNLRYDPGTHGSGSGSIVQVTANTIYILQSPGFNINIYPASSAYVFSHWDCRDNALNSVTVTNNSIIMPYTHVKCEAQWDCAPGYHWNSKNTACIQDTYSVTYSCGSHGSGTPVDSNSPYVAGTNVTTLAANVCTVDIGYTFGGWACDNNVGTVLAGTTFTMPSANVTCTAQWGPVIRLRWNTNGGTPGTVSAPAACVIGSAVGQPGSISGIAQPTRIGYEFLGWDVMWNFANINVNLSGANRYARSAYSCWYNGNSASCSNTVYNDISAEMWKIEMSAGTVYGASQCQGFNCYCKATGFSPSGNNRIYQPSAELEWKYIGNMVINGMNTCAYMCAQSCSNVSEQNLESILGQETIFGQ